jgi:hypothetical protein
VAYDIAEPDWWSRARHMHANGAPKVLIAYVFGKSWIAVHCAIDPAYRERSNLKRKLRARPRHFSPRDNKRLEARKLARDRWRGEGKIRSLTRYYRDLECL